MVETGSDPVACGSPVQPEQGLLQGFLLEPSMRGFVPTPAPIVDLMVARLFDGKPPTRSSTILDPGCGPGAFEDGLIRWCRLHHAQVPEIVAVELDRRRSAEAARSFEGVKSIRVVNADFLTDLEQQFDYVIGNPPYVPITSLGEREKVGFRKKFATARGRFDLYLLFFEQGLRALKRGGRLVFITPEKFLYTRTAEPLRRILGALDVQEVRLVDEETFGNLVTYPTITTVDSTPSMGRTRGILRDGTVRTFRFPADGSSLLPSLNGHTSSEKAGPRLEDICVRVSCGVATGADDVYVVERGPLPPGLAQFAYPTISGRQLPPDREQIRSRQSMLLPYDQRGKLLPFRELGALARYLESRRDRLLARTCVRHKPWYAFHDSAPLPDILRPKLLCKDITSTPHFWFDRAGTLVPRHSVYYIVPRNPARLDEIARHLNSPDALKWIRANCQRAANGFLRLQSAVLKRLPIPASLADSKPDRAGPKPTVQPIVPRRERVSAPR